jgi:hypothetical protein
MTTYTDRQKACIKEAIEAAFEERDGWRTKIAAAVRALPVLESTSPVDGFSEAMPEGYALVPIDPTGEMIGIAHHEWDNGATQKEIWRAMIKAAPVPSQPAAPAEHWQASDKGLVSRIASSTAAQGVTLTEQVKNSLRRLMGAINAYEKETGIGGWYAERVQECANSLLKAHGEPLRFGLGYENPLAAAPTPVADSRAIAPGAHLWHPAEIPAPTEVPRDFLELGDRKAYAFKNPGAGEHDAWYVVLPCGASLKLGYHADDAVDKAHAEFIAGAINTALDAAKPGNAALVARIVGRDFNAPHDPIKWPYPIDEGDVRVLIDHHQRDGKKQLDAGLKSSGSYLIRVAETLRWCLEQIAAAKPVSVDAQAAAVPEAAVAACALMIKGICMTHPQDVWTAKIKERICYMLGTPPTESTGEPTL